MKHLPYIFAGLIGFFSCTWVNGQEDNTAKLPVQMSIPASARLSLASSTTDQNSLTGSGTQQIISPKTNGKFWINYSSIVESNSTNSIYANLMSGDIPGDVAIDLNIGEEIGTGIGQVGKSTGTIRLSTYPQPIITNIGTCFTGQGANKGHSLNYIWKLLPNHDPKVELKDLDLSVGVIYTISTTE